MGAVKDDFEDTLPEVKIEDVGPVDPVETEEDAGTDEGTEASD